MNDGIHDMTCKECGAWFDALEGEQHSCPECGSAEVVEVKHQCPFCGDWHTGRCTTP